MRLFDKYSVFYIVLIYLLANFFMFSNNGWYWDDWCISSSDGLDSIFKGIGLPYMIPIHKWLQSITTKPALLYHILTCIVEILGLFVFYQSLLMLNVRPSHVFFITALFVLAPYNQARILLVCLMYTLGLFLLLTALWLFIMQNKDNSIFIRILSLLFFFISFILLPSALVISLAFFLFFVVLNIEKDIALNVSYIKSVFRKLITIGDFILLPFAFWVFRSYFLKPTGSYAASGYREFSLTSILLSPIQFIIAFVKNTFGLGAEILSPLRVSVIFVFLFLFVFAVLFFLLKEKKFEQPIDSNRMLYVGMYFFVAAVFPYLMVGLMPEFNGVVTRHQILIKFAFPFLAMALIGLFYKEKIQRVAFILLASLFVVTNISWQLQYQKSWFKQTALERAFRDEKLLTENTNFVIIDNTLDYNEYKTHYVFYNYTGILKKAYNTESRFAIDQLELPVFSRMYFYKDLVSNPFYHMKDCKDIHSFKYNVVIDPGKLILDNTLSIKLMYYYYFNEQKFNDNLGKILKLKIQPFIQ